MGDEHNNQGNQTPGDGGQGNQGNKQPEKTFTQAELDAVIADRLQREREKTKDYADLKKAADEYQKLKEAQMTETEKHQSMGGAKTKTAPKDYDLLDKFIHIMITSNRTNVLY